MQDRSRVSSKERSVTGAFFVWVLFSDGVGGDSMRIAPRRPLRFFWDSRALVRRTGFVVLWQFCV